MTLIRSIAVAAALVATAGLCAAQGTAPAAAASPAKKELVQKVLQLQQTAIENTARGLAEQSVAPLVQQVGMVLQQRVAPDKREALTKEIQADFKKYADETVPLLRERATKLAPSAIGSLLEERLSEDELKQTIAMLEAPIYKKYHALAFELQRTLTEKLVADTRSSVEPKLQALQEALGKRLNAAGVTNAPQSGAPAASGAKPAAAAKPAASTPKK